MQVHEQLQIMIEALQMHAPHPSLLPLAFERNEFFFCPRGDGIVLTNVDHVGYMLSAR